MTNSLLETVIQDLDFNTNELYETTPFPQNITDEDWLNKSDWIKAASTADAEKIFFVDNNPTVVFAKCDNTLTDRIKTFNKIWCLLYPAGISRICAFTSAYY